MIGRVVAAAYVAIVAGVATLGFARDSTAEILLAVLLALPTGVPALVGYYVAYGLLAQVPGANPDSASGSGSCTPDGQCRWSSTGDVAAWFEHTTDVLGVLALAGAAIANVWVFSLAWNRLRARRAPSG